MGFICLEYLSLTREICDIFYICFERSPFLLVLCHLFLYILIRFFSAHGSFMGEYIESIHTQELIEIYCPVMHRKISFVCVLEFCEGKKLFTQQIELVELSFEEIILPYCRLWDSDILFAMMYYPECWTITISSLEENSPWILQRWWLGDCSTFLASSVYF